MMRVASHRGSERNTDSSSARLSAARPSAARREGGATPHSIQVGPVNTDIDAEAGAPRYDLALEKLPGNGALAPGGAIVYRIAGHNLGNRAAAARELDINPSTLFRKLKTLGLDT